MMKKYIILFIILIGVVFITGCVENKPSIIIDKMNETIPILPETTSLSIKMIYVPGDPVSERITDRLDILSNNNVGKISFNRWGYGDDSIPEEYKNISSSDLPIVFINEKQYIRFTIQDVNDIENKL